MDSAANPSGLDINVHVMPLYKKIVKMEHNSKKPLSSSIRAALRYFSSKRKAGVEKILSLEGVIIRPNKVIDLSSLKRKRTTRGGEEKSYGLSVSSSQPSYEYVNPESSLETPSTFTLHECIVIADIELKHTEENIPSSDVEALVLGCKLLIRCG